MRSVVGRFLLGSGRTGVRLRMYFRNGLCPGCQRRPETHPRARQAVDFANGAAHFRIAVPGVRRTVQIARGFKADLYGKCDRGRNYGDRNSNRNKFDTRCLGYLKFPPNTVRRSKRATDNLRECSGTGVRRPKRSTSSFSIDWFAPSQNLFVRYVDGSDCVNAFSA
jgi:hypothetical protein